MRSSCLRYRRLLLYHELAQSCKRDGSNRYLFAAPVTATMLTMIKMKHIPPFYSKASGKTNYEPKPHNACFKHTLHKLHERTLRFHLMFSASVQLCFAQACRFVTWNLCATPDDYLVRRIVHDYKHSQKQVEGGLFLSKVLQQTEISRPELCNCFKPCRLDSRCFRGRT